MTRLPSWWLRTFSQRLQLKNLWHATVVAILAVAAAFGGLDTVSRAKPVSLGQGYTNGPLKITPTEIFKACDESQFSNPNARYAVTQGSDGLVLVATIENVDDVDIPFGARSESMLEWAGLDGAEPAGIYIGPDSVPAEKIQSGKKAIGIAVWNLPGGSLRSGQQVDLRIYDYVFRQRVLVPTRVWGRSPEETYGEVRAKVAGC